MDRTSTRMPPSKRAMLIRAPTVAVIAEDQQVEQRREEARADAGELEVDVDALGRRDREAVPILHGT